MTVDEAKKWIEFIQEVVLECLLPEYMSEFGNCNEALTMAVAALEAQPSEDCVSRSELQKTMDSLPLFRFVNNDHEEADDYYNCESVDMVIRNLPSVKPKYTDEEIDRAQAVEQAYVDKMVELAVEETKRPKGKWIIKDGKEQGYDIAGVKTWYIQIMCDKCGFIKTPIEGHMWQYHYCPNCGAEMGGAE